MCFTFALHGTGHFVVDESNQDAYKSGNIPLGTLNPGTPEPRQSRTLEPWSSRTLQPGNSGTLQNLGTLPGDIAASEPWNLLLGCEAGLMVFLVVCGCSCHLLSLLIGAVLVIVIAVVHLLVAVTAGLLLTLLLLRLSW